MFDRIANIEKRFLKTRESLGITRLIIFNHLLKAGYIFVTDAINCMSLILRANKVVINNSTPDQT